MFISAVAVLVIECKPTLDPCTASGNSAEVSAVQPYGFNRLNRIGGVVPSRTHAPALCVFVLNYLDRPLHSIFIYSSVEETCPRR